MTDTDRKKLYHWFDTRVKGLIQIGEQSFFYVAAYEERAS